MKLETSKFHFVGIGGVGMCGLAELLHNMGAKVSGSDLSENANTKRLSDLGITISKGHAKENVPDVDVLVYSSAVNQANPEIRVAKERKIPIIRRAEVLAEIMHLKRGIAVGGTHGKTTTTSLLASVFIHAKMDPTVVVGGRLDIIKSTAKLGASEWLIAEADESDGSFLSLSPEVAIVTNVDSDHLDHYENFDSLKRTFLEFASKVPFYGFVVACGDDQVTREIMRDFPKKCLTYGFNSENEYQMIRKGDSYNVVGPSKELIGTFTPNFPGKHNALNSLAAIVTAVEIGIEPNVACAGIEAFDGVDRRFQLKSKSDGILIYDDYGHHPTEISSVIEAFKDQFPDKRLHVLFQPHRYSRTEMCWDEFVNCFEGADFLYMTDIYPASEAPIEGITSEKLISQIQIPTKYWSSRREEILSELKNNLVEGDIVVTMGAGDVWKMGETLITDLKKR